MPLRYKEAFGLSDNPFGPRQPVGKLPPLLTAALESQPIILHKNAELLPLYCDKIPSFRSAVEDLETLLVAEGYSLNPPMRGLAPYLVAIDGDRGAGKTTLASRLLQLMLSCTPEGEPGWHLEELWLKSRTQTVTEQIELLKQTEKSVLATGAMYSCILVDDLLAEAYPYVAQMYDNFLGKCVVFMVFTSFDPKMSEQIEKAFHPVHRFSIAPLTPDDAIAYVTARYRMFRIPSSNGISALPLYPFDEEDIRTAVAVKAWSGIAATNPVNLRLLASIMAQALVKQLQQISKSNPGFDVSHLPADTLRGLQIKLAQSYKIVTRP